MSSDISDIILHSHFVDRRTNFGRIPEDRIRHHTRRSSRTPTRIVSRWNRRRKFDRREVIENSFVLGGRACGDLHPRPPKCMHAYGRSLNGTTQTKPPTCAESARLGLSLLFPIHIRGWRVLREACGCMSVSKNSAKEKKGAESSMRERPPQGSLADARDL